MTESKSSTSSATPKVKGGALGSNAVFACMMVLFIFITDQLTKNWAESSLNHNERVPFIGEILQLRLIYNPGAAFGLGANGTGLITVLQLLISAVVIIALFKWVSNRFWVLALSLLLGGALGNVYDRLFKPPGFFNGHVVDFLELPNWPVFNVADMAVVTAASLMVLLTILGVEAKDSASKNVASVNPNER